MAFNLKKEGNLALSCNIDEFQRHHFKSQKPWGTVYKVSETAELFKKEYKASLQELMGRTEKEWANGCMVSIFPHEKSSKDETPKNE